MVNNFQTSKITTGSRTYKRNYMFSHCIYEITVNGEDGEFFNCEVMADSSTAACAVAEDLAHDVISDITYIEIHCMG